MHSIRKILFSLTVCVLAACSPEIHPSGVEVENTWAAGRQIQAYLDGNKLSDESTTSSGLVYLIEEPGSSEHPSLSDDITIHYTGYLVNGQVFDQTTGEPRTFPLSGLIGAWQEAIPMIGRGGRIKILAPPSTAYGSSPPGGGITASSVLVFDIELVDF